MVRYTANDTPDATFGTNGVVIQDFGSDDRASTLAIEPDGTLVVGGSSTANGLPLIARFLPDGSLVASLISSGSTIHALAFLPSGRVVVAESAFIITGGSTAACTGTTTVGGSDTLTVTTIPSATKDAYGVVKSLPLMVAAPGVLANDVNPNVLTLSAVLVTGPSHRTLILNSDGSFGYTPTGAYLGPDTFTYSANVGIYSSNVATVKLTVTGPDDPPVSHDDAYSVRNYNSSSGAIYVTGPGVLLNDFDING